MALLRRALTGMARRGGGHLRRTFFALTGYGVAPYGLSPYGE